MRSPAVVDVAFLGPVRVDLLGVGEFLRIEAGLDEAEEERLARTDVDLSGLAVLLTIWDGGGGGGNANDPGSGRGEAEAR